LRDQVRRASEHLRIHVTQRHNLHRRNLNQSQQITFVISAAANQSDAFLLVRKFGRITAKRRQRKPGSTYFKKSPTINPA